MKSASQLTDCQGHLTLCAMNRVRGTCVAVDGSAVLLRGRSGAGKSDLALRLLAAGARLVADDYTCIALTDGVLRASPPESLAGLLEVRGIGIIRVNGLSAVPLVAIIDLVSPTELERLPAPAQEHVLGVALPRFQLAAFEVSAAAKVRLVAEVAGGKVTLQT